METNKENEDSRLDLNQKYTVANDILFRQIEDEGILLHISSGTYYNLNDTSIIFWQALTDSKPLIPVIEQIVNEYEVERKCVIEDLQIFLQELSQNQIITHLLLKAIAKPRYIGLCIWAFRQLWWVDSRMKTLALEALNSEPNPGMPLTPELKQDTRQRVKAIAWTGKIHPVRPKCLHRSLVLHQWLSQQGIDPQLEIGWQGKVGHAWVTYQGNVLNDRQDIAEVTPRLTKAAAKTSF